MNETIVSEQDKQDNRDGQDIVVVHADSPDKQDNKGNRGRQGNPSKLVLALCAAVIASLCMSLVASAAVTYKAQDRKTTFQAKGFETNIEGEQMVYVEKDKAGHSQIQYLHLKTGVRKTLTATDSFKKTPKVSKDTVVWFDKGANGSASLEWDVFSYNLKTSETKQISIFSGAYNSLSISGNDVAWGKTDTREVLLLNLTKQEGEQPVAEGAFPLVSKGNIVYANADNDLVLFHIATAGKTELNLVGPGKYVTSFVYNGAYVLAKAADGSGLTRYLLANTATAGAKPKELTKASKKTAEYAFLELGATCGAWIEAVKGKAVVYGVNLSTGEIYLIGQASALKKFIGYSGDEIASIDGKGTLQLRKMIRSQS